MEATEHFERAADQVHVARSFVRDTLTSWGVDRRVDDLVLMTSELFTNAVLHGAGRIEVSVHRRPGRLRVEVSDHGSGRDLVNRQDVPADRIDGRGLGIVDKLSDTWGGGPDATGRTRVWLEVAVG